MAPTQTATPATQQSQVPGTLGALQTFASAIYPYTIGYPVGWSVGKAQQMLANGDQPLMSILAADRFTRNPATDTQPLILIGAQPVPASMTPESWGAFTVKFAAPEIGCQPSRNEPTTVGGESAITYIYECDGFVFWTAVVHGNLGYDVLLLGDPADNETADRAVYDQMVKTFAFTK